MHVRGGSFRWVVCVCVSSDADDFVATINHLDPRDDGEGIELVIDSGASVAAIPTALACDLDVSSNLPESVRPSYRTASGELIHVQGVTTMPVVMPDWVTATMDFAVMPITKP